MQQKKILIKGPVLSRSGYGEQARIAVRALRTRPDLFDIYLINIPWGGTGYVAQNTPEMDWIHKHLLRTVHHIQGGGQFDTSLQITIPLEFEKIAPVNIGYTAGIETTLCAPQWIAKSNETVDRIITISQHAKKVMEESRFQATNNQTGEVIENYGLQKPVDVVNYPVYEYETAPEGLDINLETTKNFLCISQWGIRKNLENTIKWFVEEFRDEEDVGLILKTNIMSDCIIDRELTSDRLALFLDKWCGERKCKVYLVHGELTPQELTWLYRHPTMKALVNIAHGEGYGLPLFEAAYNGLPLVTVTWSGQMDFITKSNKKGKDVPLVSRVDYELMPVQKEAVWDNVILPDAKWAYARESSYKRALREILTKEKHFKKQAARLQKHLHKTFGVDVIYRQFVESVYGEPIVDIKTEDLPKISLLTSVFKAADHIEQLMEDVTRQTIFEDKCEWVIINANPAGEDVEEEIILKYAKKYPKNIIYKRIDEDPGVYGVWNMGIEMSTGAYITNMNCDDRRAPWALEAQAKLLAANEDVSLVYNDSYMVHEPNQTWEDMTAETQRYNFDQFSSAAMLRGNLPHNNPMWKRTLHDTFGHFDTKYKSAADWDFWLRCAFGGAQFRKASEVLGVYYFNPEGISTNTKNFVWKQKEEREIYMKYKEISTTTAPPAATPGDLGIIL